MGKTRDLFKKIRDTEGTFHAKVGTIKDRNGKDLTEVEDINLRAIRTLEERGKLEDLSPKLREAARLRLENPELSLSQLADIASPPISKSSLHHRLKKLMEMAEEHEE